MENKKNIAVEHFVQKMNSIFKKVSKEAFEIFVFYDSSDDKVTGYWEMNNCATFLYINGCILRGATSATWEISRLLYHIASKYNPWFSNHLFEKLILSNKSDYEAFTRYKLRVQNSEHSEELTKTIIERTDRSAISLSDSFIKDVWVSNRICSYISSGTLEQFFSPYTKPSFLRFGKRKRITGIADIFANELVTYLASLGAIE